MVFNHLFSNWIAFIIQSHHTTLLFWHGWGEGYAKPQTSFVFRYNSTPIKISASSHYIFLSGKLLYTL
jgi:hypothetical protein